MSVFSDRLPNETVMSGLKFTVVNFRLTRPYSSSIYFLYSSVESVKITSTNQHLQTLNFMRLQDYQLLQFIEINVEKINGNVKKNNSDLEVRT